MNELIRKEIAEIPQVLRAAKSEPLPAGLLNLLHDQRFTHGVWMARGSSKNAAMWMSKIFLQRAAFPLFHLALSSASFYRLKGDWSGVLCVAISQSGNTPEILEGVRSCRNSGANVYGITNNPDSPLAIIANYCGSVGAGKEKGFATKSFVATLFHAWRLADAIRKPSGWLCEDCNLDRYMEDILKRNPLKELRGAVAQARSVFVLGRGILSPIASEMAMKLKEWCLIPSDAVSGEEFLHGLGGFAGRKEHLFIVLLDDDETFKSQAQTLRYLSEQQANVLAICPNSLVSRLSQVAKILPLPDMCTGLATGFAMVTGFYRAILDLSERMAINLDSEDYIRSVCPATYRFDIPSLS